MTQRVSQKEIVSILKASGACAVGCTDSGPVDPYALSLYERALARMPSGCMDWMRGNTDLRNNPENLLSGAKTIICAAFSYAPLKSHPLFADYSLPAIDYHKVVRKRLKNAAKEICALHGGNARVCVDSAPLRERYWTLKAGLGWLGLNNCLFVRDIGSKVFLGEILWTGETYREPEPVEKIPEDNCINCGKCVKACPTGALKGDGSCDFSRCLSYITIECQDAELPDFAKGKLSKASGCDICQNVCPYNKIHSLKATEAVIPELQPSEDFFKYLEPKDLLTMEEDEFKSVFGASAIARPGLERLKRNARGMTNFS